MERNCIDCKYRSERIEMVAPHCTGTVDVCKKGHTIYKAEPCKDYEKRNVLEEIEFKVGTMLLGS